MRSWIYVAVVDDGPIVDEPRRRPLSGAVAVGLVGLAAAALVWANRKDVPAAWRSLRGAAPGFVAVAVVLAVLGVANQAALHASAQRAAGLDARASELAVPASASVFLNMVAKSAGMAGLGAFIVDGRRRGRARAATVAGYVLANVVGHLSFAVTLIAGMALLAFDGRFTAVDAVAAVVFGTTTLLQLGAIVVAVRSRERLRSLFAVPRRVADGARRRAGRMVTAHVADHSAADELHAAVQMLLAQRRRAIATFGFSMLVEVIGILQLWCSMRAVGWHPGLAAPVVAYSVSVLFSIVGFVPGGLGVVEASLGALLVSMSMRSADAVAAVVLYRLVELWLPFVVGAVAAHRLRRGAR